MQPVDIVHLTLRPPSMAGSFNKLVGAQLESLTEFAQCAISYDFHATPNGQRHDDRLLLVNKADLGWRRRASLLLPTRLRQLRHHYIRSQETLAYTWGVLDWLPKLRPKLIVCYDLIKLGPLLRPHINWPCRIILSQHGLSYFGNVDAATRLYSLNSFDVVWVLTPESYEYERSRLPGYEPIVVNIPNGVDADRFTPAAAARKSALRAQFQLPEQKLIALFLSRLIPKKGAHLILHSWQRIVAAVPNAYLWIVGGGEPGYVKYLKNLAAALGVEDSVRLEGEVSAQATQLFYQASDLYLFPTLATEGMALTLLEALGCGLPCVVSAHRSAQALYSNAELLFVAEPNLEDAFVAPIVKLLKDAALRRAYGSAGRRAVETRYSQKLWLETLRTFYQRQLAIVASLR